MAIQTLFYLSTQRKAYHASNGLPLTGPWYPWSVRPLHTKYTELQWFPVIIGTPHIPEWTLLDEVLFKCGEVTLSARLVSSLYHSLDQIVTTQHTHTHTHTQHNNTTAQQHNSTTVQQHNNTTVQQTLAHTHTHSPSEHGRSTRSRNTQSVAKRGAVANCWCPGPSAPVTSPRDQPCDGGAVHPLVQHEWKRCALIRVRYIESGVPELETVEQQSFGAVAGPEVWKSCGRPAREQTSSARRQQGVKCCRSL